MSHHVAPLLLLLLTSCADEGAVIIPAGPGLCPQGLDGCAPPPLVGVIVSCHDAGPTEAAPPDADTGGRSGWAHVVAPSPSLGAVGLSGGGGRSGGASGIGVDAAPSPSVLTLGTGGSGGAGGSGAGGAA
jgi:hypothetical protein